MYNNTNVISQVQWAVGSLDKLQPCSSFPTYTQLLCYHHDNYMAFFCIRASAGYSFVL